MPEVKKGFRCQRCGKLLFKWKKEKPREPKEPIIEIKCPRCGNLIDV